MKENKVTIIINKPAKEIFDFTLNPKNSPLWISSIDEEICSEYPTKKGTIYKNKANNSEWDVYEVTEFEYGKTFTFKQIGTNYSVRYTFNKLDENKAEVECFEWVDEGELENSSAKELLTKLKEIIETS